MDIIKKRLRERAEQRFADLLSKTKESILSNELLLGLEILTRNETVSRLKGDCGHCPSVDLLDSSEILLKRTNYKELKEKLIDKCEKEETDKFMSQINLMRDYIQ